jgi:hypothetical protein
MAVNRVVTNILSDRLAETGDLSVELLDFQANVDEDRYIPLSVPGNRALEVTAWRRDQERAPTAYRQRPTGTIPTVVVDDVDAVHERMGKDRRYGRHIAA